MKKHYYHQLILEICDKKHLPVEEIYKAVLLKFPAAGKSTIYRNVEELYEIGSLKKLTGFGGKSLFEKNHGDSHAHLIDEKNGLIEDIALPEIFLDEIKEKYQIKGIDLKIFAQKK
jgi:Fe2+ or Zn2+ uptake regulation protein